MSTRRGKPDKDDRPTGKLTHVRNETRDKIDIIRHHRRWTIVDTIDAAVDYYLAQHPELQEEEPPCT